MNILKILIKLAFMSSFVLGAGLVNAGQSCIAKIEYGASTTSIKCNFIINSVPGNRTISATVNADGATGGPKGRDYARKTLVAFKRGNTVVKQYQDEITFKVVSETTEAGIVYQSINYNSRKVYDYKKGGLGQFNYTLAVSIADLDDIKMNLNVVTNR